MIDRTTIERILDTAKVEEVVSDFVALKKRGVNFLGLCPFHNEKTPSFTVSPSKNLWKCFGCGKGGKAVHFIMEHEQLSYYDALRWLARKYNIEIKERELTTEEKEVQSLRESLFVVNQFAQDYFVRQLKESQEGKTVGMAYFAHRGLREETIEKFRLGYSPERREALAKEIATAGFNTEMAVLSGLCFRTEEGRVLDRFWGRVIFPVHTLSGKVVAFGGRLLKANPNTGKYVNSPESEIYHKSDHLYGLYFAKQAIMQEDNCILVEGYLDVISMYQAGIRNVVASSGTSLTTGQIRLIHRFTNRITVLYDGDKAGIKASLRGIDMLLEEGMEIKVALLPEGEDPDSFSQSHSTEEVKSYLREHEVDFIRFKTDLLMGEVGEDPIRRAGLIGDIVKSISVIPNDILRSEYLKKCSDMMGIREEVLVSETAKLRRESAQEKFKRAELDEEKRRSGEGENAAGKESLAQNIMAHNENNPVEEREKAIIQFILRNGDKQVQIPQGKEDSENPYLVNVVSFVANDLRNDGLTLRNELYKRILDEAASQITKGDFCIERYFIAHPNAEMSRLAAELCNDRYQLSQVFAVEKGEDRNENAILFEQGLRLSVGYKLALVDELLKEAQRALKDPSVATDNGRLMELMNNFKFLKETQVALNGQLKKYGFGSYALNA